MTSTHEEDAVVEEVKEKSEEEKHADLIRDQINRERLEAQKVNQGRKAMWVSCAASTVAT